MIQTNLGLLLGLFLASLLASLLTVPLARRLALWLGLVDRPDGRRKMHDRAIPVAGGIAILTAGAGVLLLALALAAPVAELFATEQQVLTGLLLGAVVICLVGVADDARGLRGRHKLLGQVVAVALVLLHGVRVEAIQVFVWRFELGWFAVPFTMF